VNRKLYHFYCLLYLLPAFNSHLVIFSGGLLSDCIGGVSLQLQIPMVRAFIFQPSLFLSYASAGLYVSCIPGNFIYVDYSTLNMQVEKLDLLSVLLLAEQILFPLNLLVPSRLIDVLIQFWV
jgi:hypothetical protein